MVKMFHDVGASYATVKDWIASFKRVNFPLKIGLENPLLYQLLKTSMQ